MVLFHNRSSGSSPINPTENEMPIAKLRSSSTPEGGSDSLDNFIRQAIGKEPHLSFSRSGDTPVQWVQLLNALDQQDLPGWPFLSPLKLQMQKCEKCSREFCSSINYRRHIRVHRRSLNPDKDSTVNRELLGAFWDKLSFDDAIETVSLKNVTLEEVPGSSILKALTSFVRKPGFSALPQMYIQAGSALLDLVQVRASRLPISSKELFTILDDASEKTFLCGTAVSMQKYIFDGEAGKIGLEMKNLVASTSFLVEQQLVKALVAYMDAESLRCQKLLVEEEEAAQKRKADLAERRRQKKLRQKAKEQANAEKAVSKYSIAETMNDIPSTGVSASFASDHDSHTPGTPPDIVPSLLESIQPCNVEQDTDAEAQSELNNAHLDLGTCLDVEQKAGQGRGCRQLVVEQWHVPKFQQGVQNSFHAISQNAPVPKPGSMQRNGTNREPRASLIVNGGARVWTRKPKSENDGLNLKNMIQEAVGQPNQNMSCEVLIGSISVALGKCSRRQVTGLAVQDDCVESPLPKKKDVHEKPHKLDSGQSSVNRSTIKLWRPVSRHYTRGSVPSIHAGSRIVEIDVATEKANDRTSSSENYLTSCATDDNHNETDDNLLSPTKETANSGCLQFSSRDVEAFLGQRWKEALAAEHTILVLSPDSEPPGCPETQNGFQVTKPVLPNSPKHNVLDSAENRLANGSMTTDSSTVGTMKANFRMKSEKGVKLKYIPKQITIA